MIVLFEEKKSVNCLKPFSLTRPIQDLKSGFLTVSERISFMYNSEVKLLTRSEMMFHFPETRILSFQDITRKNNIIFLNSSYFCPKENFVDTMNTVATFDGRVIFLHIDSSEINSPELLLEGLYENDLQKVKDALDTSIQEVNLKEISNFVFYPWDLVYLNTFLMKLDFELILKHSLDASLSKNLEDLEIEGSSEFVIVSRKASISKGVFIDVTEGPVFIDAEARISPLTVITGPAYIGKKTVVSQARIREGSNIRNVCKVSGEIEESIIDSFSNKNHEGFIGHSYIGQWVNIGAMATNSDLKNTYDEVKVFLSPNEVINTGLLKVGCFIGDFSKIGIGVLINTGTVIGVGANVFFEGELVRKYVPNFAWGGKEPYRKFPLPRLMSMIKTMFSRRGKEVNESIEFILANLYNQVQS
ncbi:MAG: putative sugar nucleotidyl transferase [Brevinematia bacterium]